MEATRSLQQESTADRLLAPSYTVCVNLDKAFRLVILSVPLLMLNFYH